LDEIILFLIHIILEVEIYISNNYLKVHFNFLNSLVSNVINMIENALELLYLACQMEI